MILSHNVKTYGNSFLSYHAVSILIFLIEISLQYFFPFILFKFLNRIAQGRSRNVMVMFFEEILKLRSISFSDLSQHPTDSFMDQILFVS